MIDYHQGPRSVAGPAAYSLTQRSARANTRRVVVCLVTRQPSRVKARIKLCHINSAFISLKGIRIHSREIHTLSLSPYTFQSSNLTVGDTFPRNNSGGRSYCLCVASGHIADWWLTAVACITAGVYLQFSFSHLINLHPTHGYIYLSILLWLDRWIPVASVVTKTMD